MASYPSFKDISLNSIRITPLYNIHPFLDDSAPPELKQSFEESGILHPPIVQQVQDGTFDLICGRKRLHALKHHFKKKSAPCLIIPPVSDPYTFFLYILTDQQVNGPLSPIETAFFLKYCLEKIDEKVIINFFLPRLGYKQQATILHQLISLSILDESIQLQIHHGFISDKIAFEFLELPLEDRSSLSSLFELLHPGTGKQKRILLLSREIAQRSQQSITTLFAEQEFQFIIEHNEMNAPQKTHNILELLQKKFYPQSSDAEQIFKDRVRSLNLPQGYELIHTLNFEKDAVYLTVSFPNLGSFEKAWRKKLFVE
ncbi:MAG: ParB/RepB/Spo0J family partition protein [Proteobacteria bacterium]|nr:ParB/RepB/Spo0J family partition protein [Pseudomonadota bacterium]MBU1649108.1 ParB/RepB/Spo0J family partition protein [Pseudomonadota bacterium]